jgi:hypothetical protein
MGTMVRTIKVNFQLIMKRSAMLPTIVIMFLMRKVKLFEIADLA